jgi:hypothetical protein
MIKFTKKILLFLVIIIFLDLVIGNALQSLYYKQTSGKLYGITKVLDNIKSEILIFGSSRAVQHYDPAIIEEKLGLSAYNVGLDGQSIIYHKAILDIILNRYKPKLIVLELYESMDFNSVGSQYDRLSTLLPYYNRHPKLKRIIKNRSYFEEIKLLSKTYPYNSLLLRIIEANFNFMKNKKSNIGFVPKEGVWGFPLTKKENLNPNYDLEKVNYFYDFVRVCKEKNIPLFVVISPKFEDCSNCFSYSQKICDQKDILLHNFSSEIQFSSNINYFQNPSHLNTEGAKKYTEFISTKLINYLNNYKKQ